MILLYSNSENTDLEQTDPFKSIGGYVSKSPIGNNINNNIFGEIPYSDFYNEKPEYRLLILKNTFSTTISNINIYIDNISINNIADYKIGFSSFGLDNCNNQIYEKLASRYSKPFYSSPFVNYNVNNKALIESILPNSTIGIWIERKIIKQRSKDLINFCNLSSIPENFDDEINQTEEIELIIEW